MLFSQITTYSIKSFGITLIFFFIALVLIILYSYVFDNVKYIHLVLKNTLLTIFLLLIGLYLAFNILFNFFMACLISPGTTENLQKFEEV